MRVVYLILSILLVTGCVKDNNQYHGSGVFETVDTIVSSRSMGEIIELNVEEGMSVKAGEVAGRIDSRQLELKKEQLVNGIVTARDKLINISLQSAPYDEEIKKYKKEVERFKKLVQSDAANRKQLEDVEYALSSSIKRKDAALDSMRKNNNAVYNEIEGLKIQLSQIDDSISKAQIVVPDNGTVTMKYAETGEFAQAGKPLFKVSDVSNIILRAYVTADIVTQIKLGDTATVFADYGSSGVRQYTGTITWVSDRAEFTPKTIPSRDERSNVVYGVKISLKNDGLLKKGMYGQVRFEGIGLEK